MPAPLAYSELDASRSLPASLAGVDDKTLAYIAGVVDLLGIIRVRELDTGTRVPVVQLSGNYMPTMNYLAGLTGTKAIAVTRSYTRAGCAEHCAEKHQHVVSKTGRWSLTGVKATVLLHNIRPYLRVQAEDAAVALSVGLNTRFKEGTVGKMRELGWEIPELAEKPVFVPAECAIEGCGLPVEGRGWCSRHYARWRRHGDPLGGGEYRV